ncbi:MAG: hypothetical protein AABX89_06910 [Candidatus Thermoplasmatota archaeon]
MKIPILLAALLAVSSVAAQQGPTALDSIALQVNVADAGVAGNGSDDCLILDTSTAPAAGIQNFDLRLTPCQGRPAGSLVGDDASVEKSFTYTQANGAAAETVLYTDLNSNGRYDGGDGLYLTSGPGFPTSQTSGTWTVRLTATGGFAAGTLVFSGDADHQAYGAYPTTLAASLTWVDNDGTGATFTPPDPAYLVPRAAGALPAGSLVPVFSVTLNSPVQAAAPSSPAQALATSASTSVPPLPAPSAAPSTEAEMNLAPTAGGQSTPLPLLAPLALALAARFARR